MEFEIPSSGSVLGRSDSADVRVLSAYVKRHHVRLLPVPGGIGVEDLSSTNGTAVNGSCLTKPGLLRAGDRLTLAALYHFDVVERG
jgi:pSer/pThr/pTyr-binding forkhead associated (FHA) protein